MVDTVPRVLWNLKHIRFNALDILIQLKFSMNLISKEIIIAMLNLLSDTISNIILSQMDHEKPLKPINNLHQIMYDFHLTF